MNFFLTEGFYLVYGLVGALALVFFPKLLAAFFLNRPPDFYKEEEDS